MNINQGFIKLYRKFTNWEWYQDHNTKILFIHLLLLANHKDKEWRGMMIKRGQLVTGRKRLSEDLGLTEQQIRTSLRKLESTQEITNKTTNRFTLVTIVNYDKYQEKDFETTNGITNKQPTDNQQITTNKNEKNVKNEKNKKENIKRKKYFDNSDVNDLFYEFLDLRKKLKAVNTDRAINTLLNILNKNSDEEKILMINKSIVNSWKSIYELSEKEKTQPVPKWFNQKIKKGDEEFDEEYIKFRNDFAKKVRGEK